MRHILSALIALTMLSASTPTKGAYHWRTLYVPDYTEAYQASSEPVIALAFAKEYGELVFKACAVVEGEGELLLSYGDSGDGVPFDYEEPTDICATTYVGVGGNGEHLNKLSLYMFYYGGKEPTLYRPQIKVGSN